MRGLAILRLLRYDWLDMTDLPKVTIITPSFNQAEFLENTIQSVLEQGYPNLEYMIIDGGSTDGSLDIIKKYENRLSWWISEPDCGQSDAINKGLQRASGEIISWLNSDDLHMPGTISVIVNAFKETPDMGLIYGDVLSIDRVGHVFNVMRYADWGLDDLMTFSIIGQAGTFIRREVLNETGLLDPNFHCLMDHHLWLRIAQVAPMRYLPEAIAAARFHPQAKNLAITEEFGREAYQLVNWMQQQPTLSSRMHRLNNRVLAGAHRFNARYLLDGEMPRQSLASYMRSLRCHPRTALVEWHRMIFAVLSLLGFNSLKKIYLKLRRAKHSNEEPSLYQLDL